MILRKAPVYFAHAELHRPFQAMIAFIDDHCKAYKVEPLCKVLPTAPSIYREHMAQRRDLAKLLVRALRELKLRDRRDVATGDPTTGRRTATF